MIQILRFVWNTVAFAACVVAATTLARGPDGKGPWVIALCVVLVAVALQQRQCGRVVEAMHQRLGPRHAVAQERVVDRAASAHHRPARREQGALHPVAVHRARSAACSSASS